MPPSPCVTKPSSLFPAIIPTLFVERVLIYKNRVMAWNGGCKEALMVSGSAADTKKK